MTEVASAFVSILPSAKGFGRSLDSQVSGDLDRSGKTAGKRFGAAMKGGALAVLGGAVLAGAFLKDTIGAAGDLEQSVGAIDITPLAPGFISARVAVPALSGMRQVAYVHAKPLNQLHA